MERVRALVLGEAAPLIYGKVAQSREARQGRAETLEEVVMAETLEQAVKDAQLARVRARSCCSRLAARADAYRDFAERGIRYRELVQALD